MCVCVCVCEGERCFVFTLGEAKVIPRLIVSVALKLLKTVLYFCCRGKAGIKHNGIQVVNSVYIERCIIS